MRDRCTHHGLFGELLDLLDGFGSALFELFAVYLLGQAVVKVGFDHGLQT